MSGLAAMLFAASGAALAVGGRPGLLLSRLGPMRRDTDRRGRAFGTLGPVAGLRRRATSARDQRRRHGEVAEACLLLASILRSGVGARHALETAAAEWPELLAAAAGRAAIGGDVPAALRDASTRPGCGALAGVAAGWEVSERTGAALSHVLVAVADSLRGEAAVGREADAQLATVRATSRLLALLPVGTLLLLSGGSRAATDFLFGSPAGIGCVAAAASLVGCGVWWIRRLARSAVRSPWV
ncbi:MAG TPA: type II secretion system F family protein [Jiangellaceae bacterium]